MTPIGMSNYINQASMYNPGSSSLHPEFMVFHNDDSLSQLYIKVKPQELLFSRANPGNVLAAGLKINYQLLTSDGTMQLVDSGTVKMSINRRSSTREIVTYLNFKAPQGSNYTLNVTTTDVHREESVINFINVNKSEKHHTQNFLVSSKLNKNPKFYDYIELGDTVLITPRDANLKKARILYFSEKPPIATPPFSTTAVDSVLNFEPDSIWEVDFDKQLAFPHQYEGMYFYEFDKNETNSGFALVSFEEFFPEIKRPAKLIPPLQYITTSSEFKNLNEHENTKLAIDEFWLRLGGSVEKGKELIRIYYSRIYYSNLYFSNHNYGWRTDRGMIFTIFGPPNYVTKNDSTEKWSYNDKRSFKTISFDFHKAPSIYTENHYILKRNYYYNDFWQRAVAKWRKGEIFYLGS